MKTSFLPVALLTLAALSAPARAGVSDLLFKVEISGDQFDKPTITVTNLSPSVEITRFEMTIGDTEVDWNGYVMSDIDPPGGEANVVSPAVSNKNDLLAVDLKNFGPGESFSVTIELDSDPGGVRSPTLDGGKSWWTVFFNNGGKPNAVATAFSGPKSSVITIPENPSAPYSFRGPTRQLKISSPTDVEDPTFLNVVTVKRGDGQGYQLLEEPNFTQPFGQHVFLVAQGDLIEISVPQVVYKDIHGVDLPLLADSNPSDIEQKASERFTAIGLSVNNVAQTADPTLYRFEMGQDTEVEVKWNHEYALAIKSDFAATRSLEMEAGVPWVGPLQSDASGNPLPAVNKHWVQRGFPSIATVDGQILDNFTHPGLDIRYIVKGYYAYGPPNDLVGAEKNNDRLVETSQGKNIDISERREGSVASYSGSAVGVAPTTVTLNAAHGLENGSKVVISGTGISEYDKEYVITTSGPTATSFTINAKFQGDPVAKGHWFDSTYLSYREFTTMEQRQQVLKNFSMYGPGGITWVWGLQYGVRVAVDDVSRVGMGKVFEVAEPPIPDIQRGSDGVTWLDPGSHIKVVAAAKEATVGGLALTSWANGDGYYFAASGELDTSNGDLVKGFPKVLPNGNNVATWITPPNPLTSSANLGFEIRSLQRPVRTLWRYGTGAIKLEVTIGKHLFEDYPEYAGVFVRDPDPIKDTVAASSVANLGGAQLSQLMVEWDPVSRRLYPTIPGTFTVPWKPGPTGTGTIDIRVTAKLPYDAVRKITGHYPHIIEGPPVAIDADPTDDMLYKSIKFSTANASVDGNKLFVAPKVGFTVLLFSQIQRVGRGQPREFLRVRVVDSRSWKDAGKLTKGATVGSAIREPYNATSTPNGADRANLGTGFVYNPNNKARYNPFVYDSSKFSAGIASKDIYDMGLLRADFSSLKVLNKARLPGPIIPVNTQPGAAEADKIIIFWYDDPRINDSILWPYLSRVYDPSWPSEFSLPRIVIASQYGNEGQNGLGQNQVVLPQLGDYEATTTFDPTRFESVQVYSQPDPNAAGYNPNEEHALMAPSWRYREVSPRPSAAYALRAGDLNVADELNPGYTSKPFVLVQFFDKADNESKMKLYRIMKETSSGEYPAYKFAIIPAAQASRTPVGLNLQPHVTMKAGEPVIPFYPLGVAIGASPCKNTFGSDLLTQETYWTDYKRSYWAISGGENAWFSASFYYPLDIDFYWPAGVKTPIRATKLKTNLKVFSGPSQEELKDFASSNYGLADWKVPQTGDCVAFLPSAVGNTGASSSLVETNHFPKPILYKADWPDNPAILKAGETLTYSGGENRADNPTTTIVRNGVASVEETPGLPQMLAFASAEVVFDSVNPNKGATEWTTNWTARVVPALEKRTVSFPVADYPAELQPASGRVRVKGGKYTFNDLPASLQRRLRYDPLATTAGKDDAGNVIQVQGVLEFSGLLNDKDIGDATLTASPPAVYVLEPNILTLDEVNQIKAIVKDQTAATKWVEKVDLLYATTRDPENVRKPAGYTPTFLNALTSWFSSFAARVVLPQQNIAAPYYVGLMKGVVTDGQGAVVKDNLGTPVYDETKPIRPLRAYGPGLALVPNGDFLDPDNTSLPVESWITVVENNDPKFGGSPITPYIIKVDRRKRYRGAVKTVLSDNVFDENIILRSTGDFGANADRLVFEWYYRPDDGSLNVPPPDLIKQGQTNPWKLFPDQTGKGGKGRYQITLKGNPNAPEALLADTFWFARYRHVNDLPATAGGSNWAPNTTKPTGTKKYDWAGAGNSDPFHDFDLDGIKDYRAQLAMGWIKRVLDAVNPYEARIRDFDGDSPATASSMIQQFGARYEGPVALNPDKNVIENVGLIELYETVLGRGRNLSIDLSQPVSTPAISNALQLASTRLSDFYTLLGNEAYTDALDPTIGFGSDSVDYGSLAPAVHAFQNETSSLIEEELDLLRGVDDYLARPVYNRLFWNFTKGEGEAAYATNYNISDVNLDGFIDEDDAMILYPQGHGDAWGHYLMALRGQYELLRNKNFNWVSRSEFYNLQDIVIKVDFLDERKFAATAAAKAKAGAEIVSLTYRDKYVADPNAQWQGYTDTNKDRAWGVDEWARRAGQGAYFDWVTANALLPSEHPNQNLEGIQKVDRSTNDDIAVISANLNAIQRTIDESNKGYNPLGLARGSQAFDIDPAFLEVGSGIQGALHFDQIYQRAIGLMDNAVKTWDNANESRNMLRQLGNSETEFRNSTFQEDLAYRNQLIAIFGKPYDGTIGAGKMYPAGYEGPDLALYMYVPVREITKDTVPGPSAAFAAFGSDKALNGGDLYKAYIGTGSPEGSVDGTSGNEKSLNGASNAIRKLFSPSFSDATNNLKYNSTTNGLFAVNYTDLLNPKVPLTNFTNQMPIKASGYTFQAPPAWGSRAATGELQAVIGQMIQQEAEVARAVAEWDALTGVVLRTLRLANAQISTASINQSADEKFVRAKYVITNAIKAVETGLRLAEAIGDSVIKITEATAEAFPTDLPTAGLAFSPGDALSLGRAGVKFAEVGTFIGFKAANEVLAVIKDVAETALEIAEAELNISKADRERMLQLREILKGVEDAIGDESIKRIAIFKEMQVLRELSDHYKTLVDEGGRLLDERNAYNKRVAAQTQKQRYQDMTFRVARNFAMKTYRDSFDLAAKYCYQAAAAYDYETNFSQNDPGSPEPFYKEIVKSRTLGYFPDGAPAQGAGGLSGVMATMRSNYNAVKGRIGLNNVQQETGELSLRTQLFRILPKDGVQPILPVGAFANEFPAPGQDSNALWKATLQSARVPDLWDVLEYRHLCRPFENAQDASGVHIPQPGIVLKFATDITAGKNAFGRFLAGGDHAFNSSNFSTKIATASVYLADYQSDDILAGLAAAPRVYLIPIGLDVMRVARGENPDETRTWSILDQVIPVPLPATNASIQSSGYIPLLDSLNGNYGEQRRFSSFRAYHNGTDSLGADDAPNADSRLIGRSVWNTQWMLIIPGKLLNGDPNEGLDRLIDQISDIQLIFNTYSQSGG